MDFSNYTALITDFLTGFSVAALSSLGALLLLAGGTFLIRWGYNLLTYDQSLQVFGVYINKVPWKGYHRFRSKKWNMEHM